MDSAEPADAAAAADLVAHFAWVRRLAHALVRDADRADDLAQDAMRVTLEQPADRVRAPQMKSWLRGVVRRLLVDRRRADASRAARERSAAPRPTEPSAHEVVARLDQQQRVAKAVRELAEPYRSTILYRYLDELSTREVAKRMEVSEELVRKRLARALAQLRQRLDAEFGSDTKSWALALLSLPGAAVVAVKWKLAVAAVVVIGAALTWQALVPGPSRSRGDPVRAAELPAPAVADGLNGRPGAATSDNSPTRESAGDPASTAAGARLSDATILHVSVVDADHQPCTSGRLVGFWSEETTADYPQGRDVRLLEADIAGATTDVVLPALAASALISASVEGLPPSRIESIGKLRTEEDPKSRHGRVERDVTLEVAGGVGRPRLTGRILVDGRPRTPRGLVITCRKPAAIRVDALGARYEIGPVDGQADELCVTSCETAPQFIPIAPARANPPKDVNDLDLDLSSGVTLRLNVFERTSGAPLPGADLCVRVDIPPDGSHWSRVVSGFQHHVVAGADGVAVVSGLPRGGAFSILRDATSRVRRVVEMGVGTGQKRTQMLMPREALLAEAVEMASPALIERTLRIDAEDRTLHVFGDLAATFLAPGEFGEADAEIRFATRGGDLQFTRMRRTVLLGPAEDPWRFNIPAVPHDANGHWQFEAEAGVDYQVWVEREHRRVSEVATVRAEEADVGPVALRPRRGTDVLLRIVHCPMGGRFGLLLQDPDPHGQMGTDYPFDGTTFERRLRLERPTTIVLSETGDEAKGFPHGQHSVEVDPATMPVVEIDMGSDAKRMIHFELGAGELPRLAHLSLSRVAADGTWVSFFAVRVTLENGDSSDPVWIDPGRYFYDLWPSPPGVPRVNGVVDVERSPDDRRLAIRCELEPHPRTALGAGVEITEVAGVRPYAGETTRQRFRFADEPALATADTIYLPKDAKFTVLER
jgi:RNA polymerase sigma factor (sigma-70 family)